MTPSALRTSLPDGTQDIIPQALPPQAQPEVSLQSQHTPPWPQGTGLEPQPPQSAWGQPRSHSLSLQPWALAAPHSPPTLEAWGDRAALWP